MMKIFQRFEVSLNLLTKSSNKRTEDQSPRLAPSHTLQCRSGVELLLLVEPRLPRQMVVQTATRPVRWGGNFDDLFYNNIILFVKKTIQIVRKKLFAKKLQQQ